MDEHEQSLDELKSLGGQETVDPVASTQLIFNLRPADRIARDFHAAHERSIPKTHLLPDNSDQQRTLVPVGAEESAWELEQNAETPPPRPTVRDADLLPKPKSKPVEERSVEKPKRVDTVRKSLEKSPVASTGTDGLGLTFSSSSGSSRPLPSLGSSGGSFVKSLPIGREYDPFSSVGFILPPKEIVATTPQEIAAAPEPEEPVIPESIQPIETSDPAADCDVSKKVRMQYEKLPYPFRDPDDDKKNLTMPLIDNLMVVNQRCYQGKKNFHDEFRVLVAGGGTGDASTYLAVQTAWLPNAKVVYVDLSTESMKIAKQRLHNQAVRLAHPDIEKVVEFHHGSLLDVEKMGLGRFDYINCSGVLHHLKDPDEGLAALRSVLKDDGAMSIMVYGQVGRTTIYQVQEMMRIVNRNVEDMDEKIKNTNLFLRYLPPCNLHRLGGRWGANESNPIEIYDLFLHSQDRAYTIDQLYEWVQGCGMHIAAFSSGQHSFLAPEMYPHALSRKIRERIKRMSVRDQRVFSEVLYGHINKFEFHITPQSDSGVDLLDLDLIPCFSLLAKQQNMANRLAGTEESASLYHIPNHIDKLSFTIHSSPFAKGVYRLIDDAATVGKMLQKMQPQYPQMSDEAIHRDILKNLKQLMQYDIIHLRHKSCRCERLNRGHF